MSEWRTRVREELEDYQQRTGESRVTLDELREQVLPRLRSEFPENDHPDAGLRRTLQELRDQGDLDFLGNGEYRLLLGDGRDLQQAFTVALQGYPDAKENKEWQHQAATLIKETIPDELSRQLSHDHLEITGSVGKGKMTHIPWIGIFDDRVTTTPQDGLYVVYLFDTDGDMIYLTLNQGMAELNEEFSRSTARRVLQVRAEALRDVIDIEGFENGRIHLPDHFTTSRNALYGIATICYRMYELDEMPSTATLIDDARKAVTAYQDLIESSHYETLLDAFNPDTREQPNPFDESNDSVTGGPDPGPKPETEPEPDPAIEPAEEPRRADEIAEQLGGVGQVVFHGPPGTGKTYTARKFARWWLHQHNDEPTENQLHEVTFHPSFTYEDFVEGLSAKTKDGDVIYDVESGIFKQICDDAKKAYESAQEDNRTPPRYVLIIDEINRGKLSKIFGEAITLLESDKRAATARKSSVKLSHSGDPFVIPPNLYLIGTMNTADRSIALVDAALRRRFSFHSFPPEYDVLIEEYDYGWSSVEDAQSEALSTEVLSHRSLLAASIASLRDINRKILDAGDLGKGKRVGHSYLLGTEDTDDVVNAWRYQILPLLEEYYFEDFDRLQSDLFGTTVPALFDQDRQEIARFDAVDLHQALTDLLARSNVGSRRT